MISYDLFFTIFLSFIVWDSFRRSYNHEREVARTGVIMQRVRGRVTTVGTPLLFPLLMLIILLYAAPILGLVRTLDIIAEISVHFMMIMTVYYAFLLVVMPIFRKIFSARACAYLWILPAALYNFIHIFTIRSFTHPKLILRFPKNFVSAAIAIWITGFITIMVWTLVSHLRFRKEILEDARKVTDEDALKLWNDEQDLIERKRAIPLVISEKIASPMTIGVWDKKLVTVLPANHYTIDELQLIFRHELRHIQRQDGDTKAFLAFYRAFCWFNPLVWIASKKASEDIELSCDEMVLYNADETKRRKYAELLLDTAGDGRGFSTCLSASASTLRYRLKNAVTQRKRLSGTLLMAVVIAVVMLGGKAIAVSFDYGTIGEVLFENKQLDYDDYVLFDYESKEKPYQKDGTRAHGIKDIEKLWDYISSLNIVKIGTMMDGPTEAYKELHFFIRKEDGAVQIWMMDDILEVKHSKASGLYIIEDNIDWELIESCMDFEAENPDPPPVRPTLGLFFDPPLEPYEEALYAQGCVLSIDNDGEKKEYEFETSGWGGLHGYKANKAFLNFNYEPEEFYIEIEGMNGEGKETVKPSQLGEGNALDLKPYYARYTVYGKFNSHRHTTYEMAFYFEINPNQR